MSWTKSRCAGSNWRSGRKVDENAHLLTHSVVGLPFEVAHRYWSLRLPVFSIRFAMSTLEAQLAGRLSKLEILQLLHQIEATPTDKLRHALLHLLLHSEGRVLTNALWMSTHFRTAELSWWQVHLEAFTQRALTLHEASHRRLALTFLLHLFKAQSPSQLSPTLLRLLDASLNTIAAVTSDPAIISVSIKLAEVLTRHYPELQTEVKATLLLLDAASASPAVSAAQRNALHRLRHLPL